MTEEEFSALSLIDKWEHVSFIMQYIFNMDKLVANNPIKKPNRDATRSMRKDQYERWAHVKNLYGAHRDEMANTLNDERYSNLRGILERVFTLEVDDALAGLIGDQ